MRILHLRFLEHFVPKPALIPSLALLVVLLWAGSGCEDPVEREDYRILRALPHDTSAYTQGLVFHDGFLYESAGRYGLSDLRKVDPETGEVVRVRELPREYFAEGLARVDSVLIQLTWRSGTAFIYDLDTFEPLGSFDYEGEGWGLCFDGESLFMSNGSNVLQRRDPATFEVREEIRVTLDGLSVWKLNELECVGEEIYANVFQSNDILSIDKHSGEVRRRFDGLLLSLSTERPPNPEAVLNGIAYDPERDVFYMTGKLWAHLFEVEIGGR